MSQREGMLLAIWLVEVQSHDAQDGLLPHPTKNDLTPNMTILRVGSPALGEWALLTGMPTPRGQAHIRPGPAES